MKLLLVFVGILCAFHSSQGTGNGSNARDFTLSLRKFSGSMFSAMENVGSEENMVYSPFSVAHMLGMLMNGAAGLTEREIQTALMINKAQNFSAENYHKLFKKTYNKLFNKEKVKSIETVLAARIFLQEDYPLFHNYTDQLKDFYFSDVETTDFSNKEAAANQINSWISEATEEQITDLIAAKDLEENTRLVLTNALYFNALWKDKLESEGYENQPFDVTYDRTDYIPFMGRVGMFKISMQEGYKQISIPYKDEQAEMIIALPDTKEDMVQFLRRTKLISYFSTLPDVKWTKTQVNFSMPIFDLEYETDAKAVLERVGVRKLFQPSAELPKMAEEGLYCGDIKHKTKITVNEKGTEAAAASAGFTLARSSGGPYDFIVDKPFFFTIYREDSVLFTGKIMNPPSTEADDLH